MVIEVKTQASLTQAPYLPLLAQKIHEHRGWRLGLVVANTEEDTVAEETDVPLGEPDIAKRVDDIKHFLDASYVEAIVSV